MIKNRVCNYCKIIFYNIKSQEFANHVRWCDKNTTNGDKGREKNRSSNKKIADEKYGKLKTFNVECHKCKNKFEIEEKEKLFPIKDKYFCSRSCANSRVFSDETRKKRSLSNSKASIKAYKNGQIPKGGRAKWYKYKNIKVQGTFELRACVILDKLKIKKEIKKWEYTNDRISYIDINGKNRSYLFDFKVIDNKNNIYYIETKGFMIEQDKLKWKATKKQNIVLKIWFKQDLINIEKQLNIENLWIKLKK